MAANDDKNGPKFAQQGGAKRASFVGEYIALIKASRKWWLLPLLVFIGVFALLVVLSSTGAAPFLYTLF